MLNEKTGICQICSEGCSLCKDRIECATCNENLGYGLENSTKNCVPCTERSYIQENICFQCTSNCAQCSSSQCDICDTGYYLNDEQGCSICSVYCLSCTDKNSCSQCEEAKGYAIS